MSDARFNIVFSGELVAGADPAKVRENLAKVFKMDLAKVEALFSGKPVVIKKGADEATATKFRAVLRQAGAQCEVVPLDQPAQTPAPEAPAAAQESAASPEPGTAPSQDTAPPSQPPQTPESAEPASAAPPRAEADPGASSADMETVGTIRTGGTGFTPEFNVAPVGADMADKADGPPPEAPDISHLSMAPPGTDLEQLPDQRETVNPDISHLTLAEESADKS